MIPKSGKRFAAFAKPASAAEGRPDKIMRKRKYPDLDQIPLDWIKV
jgi:hypothetical protein